MENDIQTTIQSENSFVRKDLNKYHFYSKEAILHSADKFKDCRYQIYIPLIANEHTGVPEFSSITIKNSGPQGNKAIVITAGKTDQDHSYEDKARFGEFVFLLAAKLKYDLLHEGLDYIKAGFLYSRELVRLSDKCKTTQVPPSIIKTLNRFCKRSNNHIIRNLFFEKGQLWHLVCYYGKAHADLREARYMYWLNASAQNIHFVKENKQKISGNELAKALEKLFPAKYLINDREFKEFVDILQEEKTKRFKTERDAEFIVKPDEIGSEAVDKSNIGKHLIDFTDFIEDRTKEFIGRDFVFEKIADFIKEHDKGYLVIKGDPGIGKSSIIANLVTGKSRAMEKLAKNNEYVYHFNIASEVTNKTAFFLKNVCAQLIINYRLDYTSLPTEALENNRFFSRLLAEASVRIKAGKKILIIIDALDEVDNEGLPAMANTLCLPIRLPDNVYVIATARDEDIRLRTECEHEFWPILHHSGDNKKDICDYIKTKTDSGWVKKYIKKNKMNQQAFIDHMLEKSDGNFMYLRHVLPEIESGAYQDLDIEKLPSGLKNYYEDHWRRMGMLSDPSAERIEVLYTLSCTKMPVSCELLAKFAGTKAYTVQGVLNKWSGFLHKQGHGKDAQYSFYHKSFTDFLHRKDIMQQASIDLPEVKKQISSYFKKQLFKS